MIDQHLCFRAEQSRRAKSLFPSLVLALRLEFLDTTVLNLGSVLGGIEATETICAGTSLFAAFRLFGKRNPLIFEQRTVAERIRGKGTLPLRFGILFFYHSSVIVINTCLKQRQRRSSRNQF